MQKVLTIIEILKDFNVWSIMVRLLLAAVLSGIIGIEREKLGRAAGLRTHLLVCIGSTIAAMVGLFIHQEYGTGDVTRIAAQVISGIGFLGAGTILVKNKSIVTGLTTAACVWATGTIGIAIGYGFYEAAIIGAALIFLVTWKMSSIDLRVYRNASRLNILIEFEDAKCIHNTLKAIEDKGIVISEINLSKPKTNTICGISAELFLKLPPKSDPNIIIDELNELSNVTYAVII